MENSEKISRGEDMVNLLPPHFQNWMQVYNKFRDALEKDPTLKEVVWFETYQGYRQGYRFDVQFLQRKYIEKLTEGVVNLRKAMASNVGTPLYSDTVAELLRFLKHNLNIKDENNRI